MIAMACLVLFSALVTAIGSHTVLDTRTNPSVSLFEPDMSYNPNVVTVTAARLATGTERLLLAVGTALYGACRSITALAVQSGKAVLHAAALVGSGFWHGAGYAARALYSGVVFALHAPGKLVGLLTTGHSVSAILRPADDQKVPVISSETSRDALTGLSVPQQQAFALLQAAQAAANRSLGGAVVAGDPNHGGYPAAWDNAAQDSRLDSWGMYNRECVSYVAWKVYQTYGFMPYWGGVGNANQWVRDARRADIPTGLTPVVHSVAISMSGYYGHAMWVEKVSGNMIYVSQYNYDLRGHYSEMWVDADSFTYIYFQ